MTILYSLEHINRYSNIISCWLLQVRGLQAEYGRLADASKGAPEGGGPELSRKVQRLESELSAAQQEREAALQRAAAAEKARRSAEKNVDALATQAKVRLP